MTARSSPIKPKTRPPKPMRPNEQAAFERGRAQGARETLSTIASAVVVGLFTWIEQSAKKPEPKVKPRAGLCGGLFSDFTMCSLTANHRGPCLRAPGAPGGPRAK